MKSALFLLFLVLSCLTKATDAMILISPDRAGPIVDEGNYIYGEWLLWPPSDSAPGTNRLLSLLTGADWSTNGEPISTNRERLFKGFESLKLRGYFLARDQVISRPSIVLSPEKGDLSLPPVLLALEGRSPDVKRVTMKDDWPKGAVLFAEVDNWDRVAEIVKKTEGRVLVIEYPPRPDRRWSRYWFRGFGWGPRLPVWQPWGVAGLIPASQAGNLLLHPRQFQWVENETSNWGGGNRWLAFVGYAAPLTLAILGFLSAFFVGCAVYLISKEEHATVAATALRYSVLLPATILAAGRLSLWLGPPMTGFCIAGAFLVLTLGSQGLGALFRRYLPLAHSMFAIFIVGFLATATSAPLWSLYSHVFSGTSLPISPEAVATFFAYVVGTCALAKGTPATWVGWALALLSFLFGIVFRSWWAQGPWLLISLPLFAIAAGGRLLRFWMLPVFALLPLADGTLIRHGVVWAPSNLFFNWQDKDALNLARHAEFLTSHGFIGSLLVAGSMAVFVEPFFFHEVRRALLRDSRLKVFFHASALCGATAIFQPLMLYPAFYSFLAGVFVLLADAARTA